MGRTTGQQLRLRRTRAAPPRPRRRRGAGLLIGALLGLAALLALLGAALGGFWAGWRAAGPEGTVVLTLATEVLPYGDDTRLLVVHVHARNPTDRAVELHRPEDAFEVTVSQVAEGLGAGDLVDPDGGEALASEDLLPDEGWGLAARGEAHDATAVVVPAGAVLDVRADLVHGSDSVGARTLVHVEGDEESDEDEGAARPGRARPLAAPPGSPRRAHWHIGALPRNH